MALHVTLDQTFGKAAGDTMNRVLVGIVDGVGAVGKAVATLAADLAGGDIGKFFADLAQDGIDLGTIAVNVAEWAIGKIACLWDWLLGAIGVTSGAFKPVGDGTEAQQPVTITDIAIDVASDALHWAAGAAESIATWVYAQAVSAAVSLSGLAIDAASS